MSYRGTTMAAARRALRDLLRARPALAGIPVGYGDPIDGAGLETIWLGPAQTADQDAVQIGRRRRDETYNVPVHFYVGTRRDPADSEDRAAQLGWELEDLVAADPTLNHTTDVLYATVGGAEMTTGETVDGPRTLLTTNIHVRARLT